MSDLGSLGRALVEAGKAISVQAANMPGSKGGSNDPAQALLPKIDLMNRKLSAVEGHLSTAPASFAESISTEIKDSVDGLTHTLVQTRDELVTQNQILRESLNNQNQILSELLESQRALKSLAHLMAVMLVDVSRKPPHTGTEIPSECAKLINQFAEPGSLETPVAFVQHSSSRGRFDGIGFYPRTAGDIGRLSETQLCMLLAEVSGKRSSDFNGLELEQLQLLVCKQLGFVARAAAATPVLRAQLRSSPANGHVAFVPQIRKLVFEFCERWPTSEPVRNVLREGAETIARENPHVEIVLKKRMFKEPVARGFYLNGRTKEICLKNLGQAEVTQRIQLLLDSSGAKIKPLKGKPVQSSTPSVRGIWSGMHVEEPFKI